MIFRPFSAIHGCRVVGWIAVILALVFYSFLTISDYLPTAKKEWRRCHKFFSRQKAKLFAKYREQKPTIPAQTAAESNPSTMGTHGPDLEANQARPRAANGHGNPSSNVSEGGIPSVDSDKPQRKNKKKRKEKSEKSGVEATKTTFDLGISGTLIIEILVILLIWSLAVMNTELLIRWNKFTPSDQSQWQFGQVLPMFLIVLPLVNLVKAFREYKLHRRTHRRRVHRNGKKRAEKKARQEANGSASSHPFGRTGAFAGARRSGAGQSPFSFPGGGMDPLADLFGSGFPFQQSSDPRGNLENARISAHSIHSQNSADSSKSSNSDSSDSDSDDRQEGPSSRPLGS